ncbi:expressed unknown protein [Seminavis robusta]|uniref:Uncharacterized protein n=1 Tax=Seminavis robusta TaxID=568900 RepID=A0A9N8EMW8_9STRA|nr:expressed unknown protein [Seminavis robusta]|eukprot:Sro1284_g259190.1 n/a (285) ;mRNA; r:9988-11077
MAGERQDNEPILNRAIQNVSGLTMRQQLLVERLLENADENGNVTLTVQEIRQLLASPNHDDHLNHPHQQLSAHAIANVAADSQEAMLQPQTTAAPNFPRRQESNTLRTVVPAPIIDGTQAMVVANGPLVAPVYQATMATGRPPLVLPAGGLPIVVPVPAHMMTGRAAVIADLAAQARHCLLNLNQQRQVAEAHREERETIRWIESREEETRRQQAAVGATMDMLRAQQQNNMSVHNNRDRDFMFVRIIEQFRRVDANRDQDRERRQRDEVLQMLLNQSQPDECD